MKKTFLWVSTILFLTAGQSLATEYFIDQNHTFANDSNSGTENLPWLTIQHASNTINAGDTVYVIGKNESEATLYDEILSFSQGTSGAEGNEIVFIALPRRSVIIKGVKTTNCNYLVIKGFKITNDYTAWNTKMGIYLDSDHVDILDNHFYDLRIYPAINAYGVSDNIVVKDNFIEHCNMGIWAKGDNWLVENNEIYRLVRGVGGDDADYIRFFGNNHVYRKNYLHGTRKEDIGVSHVDGFQTYNLGTQYAHNMLFEQNIVMDFHQGFMIRDVVAENDNNRPSTEITNLTIRNNVFVNAWSMGVGIGNVAGVNIHNNTFFNMTTLGLNVGHCNDAIIKNNIISHVGDWAVVSWESNVGDSSDDYNLFYNCQTIGNYTGAHTIINEDPLFVNASNVFGPDGLPFTADDGLRLQQGSKAIGGGENGVDIGAYEYIDDNTPQTPTGLKLLRVE